MLIKVLLARLQQLTSDSVGLVRSSGVWACALLLAALDRPSEVRAQRPVPIWHIGQTVPGRNAVKNEMQHGGDYRREDFGCTPFASCRRNVTGVARPTGKIIGIFLFPNDG